MGRRVRRRGPGGCSGWRGSGASSDFRGRSGGSGRRIAPWPSGFWGRSSASGSFPRSTGRSSFRPSPWPPRRWPGRRTAGWPAAPTCSSTGLDLPTRNPSKLTARPQRVHNPVPPKPADRVAGGEGTTRSRNRPSCTFSGPGAGHRGWSSCRSARSGSVEGRGARSGSTTLLLARSSASSDEEERPGSSSPSGRPATPGLTALPPTINASCPTVPRSGLATRRSRSGRRRRLAVFGVRLRRRSRSRPATSPRREPRSPPPPIAANPARRSRRTRSGSRRWQARLEQRERFLKDRQDEKRWEARWKSAGESIRDRSDAPTSKPHVPPPDPPHSAADTSSTKPSTRTDPAGLADHRAPTRRAAPEGRRPRRADIAKGPDPAHLGPLAGGQASPVGRSLDDPRRRTSWSFPRLPIARHAPAGRIGPQGSDGFDCF